MRYSETFLRTKHRHIYWTDIGVNNAKIERADFDGRNKRTLVDDSLIWPNGIAIDYEGK